MAPRRQVESGEDRQHAVASALRVASATADHFAEIEALRELLRKIAQREGLSRAEKVAVLHSQEEWHRFLTSKGPLATVPKVRSYDPETAVKFALQIRAERRDSRAEELLTAVSRGASRYRESGRVANDQQHSVLVLDSIEDTYRAVRAGSLTQEQQQVRIAAVLLVGRTTEVSRRAKILLVKTAKEISDQGGPRDCALERVAKAFAVSKTTMRNRAKAPRERGFISEELAFARWSNILSVTQYALSAIGWTPDELRLFGALARRLYGPRLQADSERLERIVHAAKRRPRGHTKTNRASAQDVTRRRR